MTSIRQSAAYAARQAGEAAQAVVATSGEWTEVARWVASILSEIDASGITLSAEITDAGKARVTELLESVGEHSYFQLLPALMKQAPLILEALIESVEFHLTIEKPPSTDTDTNNRETAD